ncbi:MAG: TIGR01906 family membrane protein [Eubacteriales bacterium]|nr:TIGR01906 family membrane protein [Eubacteriales bacterium]
MKKIRNLLGVAAMMLLVAALLLTSFQMAIYGDREYRFYQREYEKYQVAESLNMEMEDIMDVTDQMMAYLIGQKEELSVITKVDGRTQDFFNEQDRFHMGEVRNLFLGGLRLRNYFLIITAALIILLALWKAELGRILPAAYFTALGIFGVLTAVLGGLIASDFNKYFTIFHEIFFDNDLWIFDPATDYMIRMLPEGFFYDFVIRIGSFFVGGLVFIGALAGIWMVCVKKRENN